MSGVHMLPFSLGSALVAIISGQIVARTGKYRPVVWFGFVSVSGSVIPPLVNPCVPRHAVHASTEKLTGDFILYRL